MVVQARARNAAAISAGRVNLRQGTVENMPFEDDSFDTVLAINSEMLASVSFDEPRLMEGRGGFCVLARKA